MHDRHTSLSQQLQELAADFVSTQSNRQSLITVTGIDLSKKFDKVTFYVSVYPEDAEGPAIGFLMRKRGECRNYLKDKVSMKQLPHVEFALDEGEKNRLRVDELLNE